MSDAARLRRRKKQSVVVTDLIDQCAVMGDLRAAFIAETMTRSDVYAELGQVLVGARKGRRTDDEIIIFDSTAAAFQDLTATVMVVERPIAAGIGAWIDLQR